MKWHPSQIGKLMTNGRAKDSIGETAKSYIKECAKQDFYNYTTELNTKEIMKGREQEQDSIDLLNSVRFTDYVKNQQTIENDYLIGTADIVIDQRIIDIKTPWSLKTFPALNEDAVNPLYEWQLRAYMLLYDKPCAELIYCMVTTWDEFLNEYENLQLHRVDHINPEKRITALWYDRDEDIEAKMIARLKEASDLYHEYYTQLQNK
jgi:hypothetical protein